MFKYIYIVLLCVIFSLGYDNIIELNHDLGPHTPFFPVNVSTIFKSTYEEAGYSRGFWVAYSEVTFQDHASTFVSAPYTLNPLGIKVDEIPIKDLFASGVVINVIEKVKQNNTYVIDVQDVDDWIAKNGMFPKHCIVLFNTGWDEGRYPDQILYFGSNIELIQIYPGVSLEAIKYILSFETTHGIHIVGFGSDTGNINPKFYSVDAHIHDQNKYTIGNMRELRRLPAKGAKIMTMPVKITNGSGAPARVMARLP